MALTQKERDRLRSIKTFPSLVKYLRDELDWPIETNNFEEIIYDYDPEELGINPEHAVKIKKIHQLMPLVTNQPWGVFFVEFGNNKLSVVALRRILSQLVIKKRASMKKADQPTWHLHDLLFISNFCEDNERKITFARFTHNEETGDLPTLKVLGWDEGDTVLRMEHVQQQLHSSLRWPKDEKRVDDWRIQWSSAFTLGRCEIIRTSQELAVRLADLAGKIRIRALQVLAIESEKGPLRTLHKAFREALIHDLKEEDFADMYAQTIAYGLLAARVSRPMGITADNMADMVPITNPFLKEMLSVFLTVGGRKSGINFDELGVQDIVDLLNNPGTHMEDVLRDFGNRTQREDPVIYFYELFLKEYDSQKKVERGVFYTPQPVVSYIVRSVHELLQTEFGLEDGLASTITWGEMIKKNPGLNLSFLKPKELGDEKLENFTISPDEPFVTVLDPAIGTATFLVEVIDIIHKTMSLKWEKQGLKPQQIMQRWNEYVAAHLLTRLYGFELMMAPYAIAHMKIGLKLHETGYKFGSDERVQVYLTNSLEPPSDKEQVNLTYFSETLAHETTAVNKIKRTKRFSVVIGNPPYKKISVNMNEWAINFLKSNIIDNIPIQSYYEVDGNPIKERKVWLQDDYVKFLRFGQFLIQKNGCGIFGYITNNGFLGNPTFNGLRQSLLKTYNHISIINLHGDTNIGEANPTSEADKNIFDIQQGVAISVMRRLPSKLEVDSNYNYLDLWGSREKKYFLLSSKTIASQKFEKFAPNQPLYLLIPTNTSFEKEFNKGWLLSDIMPLSTSGIVTSKDNLVVGFTDKEIKNRFNKFLDTQYNDKEILELLKLSENYAWKISDSRSIIRKEKNLDRYFIDLFYRPFDYRRLFYHPAVVWRTREKVMSQMLLIKNIGLLATRQSSKSFTHIFCSRNPIEMKACSYDRNTEIFPLFFAKNLSPANKTDYAIPLTLNFKLEFINAISATTGLTFSEKCENYSKGSFSAYDVLYLIYAILHSQNYRTRYKDLLARSYPRVFVSKNPELFFNLVNLGSELVSVHLMESPKLNKPISTFIGSTPSSEVEKITFSNNIVWINKAKTERFRGVPENVWNFHIGGYQVCEKWLKDRKGRQLSAEDIAHYQKIIVALNETIRIMDEIDEVIEKHGGWPGAFDTGVAGAEPAAGVAEQQTLFGDDPA